MAKCNLAPELREAYLNKEEWWQHSTEEFEQCRKLFDNYLFYANAEEWDDSGFAAAERKKKEKICICSMCGEKFTDEHTGKFKSNQEVICPACGTVLQTKAYSRIRTGSTLTRQIQVTFINVTNTGAVCMESGLLYYVYNGACCFQDAEMSFEFCALERDYIERGVAMAWRKNVYADYVYTEADNGWFERKSIVEPFHNMGLRFGNMGGFHYLIGLEKLKASQLKYSAVEKYFIDYHNIDITDSHQPVRFFVKYMSEYAMNERIEMVVKMGFTEAVGKLIQGQANARLLNWKAMTPSEFVRMDKTNAAKFYINPSIQELILWRELKNRGAIKTIEELKYIENKVGYYITPALEAADKYKLKFLSVVERYTSSLELELWADYIQMGEQLGYDFTRKDVLLPKNLRERHDAAASALKIKGNAAAAKKYRARRKRLEKKYAYTMDGLSIVIPKGINDIVHEGKVLQICVGSYAERHIKGETTILFLRHARRPERSWLCIEINKRGEIQQIHGYRNENYKHATAPREKYREWLETWQQWYKDGSKRDRNGRPITREERRGA